MLMSTPTGRHTWRLFLLLLLRTNREHVILRRGGEHIALGCDYFVFVFYCCLQI